MTPLREKHDAAILLYGCGIRLIREREEQWHALRADSLQMLGCGDTEELALDDAIANFPDGVPAP